MSIGESSSPSPSTSNAISDDREVAAAGLSDDDVAHTDAENSQSGSASSAPTKVDFTLDGDDALWTAMVSSTRSRSPQAASGGPRAEVPLEIRHP
jgi:hypothetical protein